MAHSDPINWITTAAMISFDMWVLLPGSDVFGGGHRGSPSRSNMLADRAMRVNVPRLDAVGEQINHVGAGAG